MMLFSLTAVEIATVVLAGVVVLVLALGGLIIVRYGGLWLQAKMSNCEILLLDLIGMSLRKIDCRLIVQNRIMAVRAGVDDSRGVTSHAMQVHYLAGGNVTNVVRAVIAAHRAGIELDFEQAATVDLAGRDVLEMVQDGVEKAEAAKLAPNSPTRGPGGGLQG